MIKLDLPDFCQNCPEFEPDVDTNKLANDDFFANRKTLVDTTITCTHVDRCLSMMDYIVDQLKETEKNNVKN